MSTSDISGLSTAQLQAMYAQQTQSTPAPATEPYAAATPAQQAYASAAGAPTGATGTATAPYYDTPTRVGDPSVAHVTTQGQLSVPAGTPGGDIRGMSTADLQAAYAGSPSVPLKADDGTGFVSEFLRPGRNVLGWASHVPYVSQGLDAASRFVNNGEGLQDAIKGYDDYLPSQAAKGLKPGFIGSAAGSIMGTLPALTLPGGALAQGAAAGALTTDKPNDPVAVALSGAGGAALGKAGEVAGNAILNTVAPKILPAARNLIDRGIPVPTNRLAEGTNYAGALSRSLPITGEVSRATDNAALKAFPAAFAEEALSPIGYKANGASGTDLYPSAKAAIGAAYQKVADLAGHVPFDSQLASDLASLKDKTRGLPGHMQDSFDQVINDEVLNRITDLPSGSTNAVAPLGSRGVQGFTPQNLMEAKEGINGEIANFKEPDGYDRKYVSALRDARAALTNAMGRTSPAAQEALNQADAAYPGFKILQKAVKNANQNRLSPNGYFVPNDADRAINEGASMDQKASRTGPLNSLVSDAKAVLPSHHQKVTSAMNAALETVVAGGVAGSEVLGHAGLKLVAAPLLTAPYYSQPVQNVVRAGLLQSSAARQAAEQTVGPLSNYVRLPAGLIGGTAASQLGGAFAPAQ